MVAVYEAGRAGGRRVVGGWTSSVAASRPGAAAGCGEWWRAEAGVVID